MDTPSWILEERSPLVTYSLDRNEMMSAAIVYTFLAGNVDIFEREQTLQDAIDTDAIDGFDWHADSSLRLAFSMWGHQVLLTPETVRIYTNP